MKRSYLLLTMLCSFASCVFGANEKVSIRPYNQNFAWDTNLLENLEGEGIELKTSNGHVVRKGNKFGLVRDMDNDSSSVATMQIVLLKDSIDNTTMDFAYADVYAYAEEFLKDKSVTHKQGYLLEDYYCCGYMGSFQQKKYPLNVGKLEKFQKEGSSYYTFYFQNESKSDTLWINDLTFKMLVGETYEFAPESVYSADTTMGTVSFIPGSYYVGEKVNVSVKPKTGYYFYKWTGSQVSSSQYEGFYMLENPKTPACANFKAYKGNIVVKSGDSNSISVYGTGYYKDSTALEVYKGMKCFDVRWSDGYIGDSRSWSKEGNDTLYVYVNNDRMGTLTFASNDSVMGSVYGIAGDYGDTVRNSFKPKMVKDSILWLNIHRNPGYRFSHWENGLTDSTRTIYLNSLDCDSSYEFVAYFEKEDSPETFSVVVISADTTMGAVSGSGSYLYGQDILKQAFPKFGYRLEKWVSLKDKSLDVATGNDTIVAYFVRKNSYVSLGGSYCEKDSGAVDSITVSNMFIVLNLRTGIEDSTRWSGIYDVKYGDTLILTAKETDSLFFVRWEDGNSDNPRTVVCDKDSYHFAAVYSKEYIVADSFFVDVLSNNDSLGTVAGKGWYKEGENVVIEAIANDNAVFEKWSDGVVSSKRVLKCLGDTSLTAFFGKIGGKTDNLADDDEWEMDSVGLGHLSASLVVDLTKLSYNKEQKKFLTLQASVEIIQSEGCNAFIECYADAELKKYLGKIVLKANGGLFAGLFDANDIPSPSMKPSMSELYSESCELPVNTNYLKIVLDDENADSYADIEGHFMNMQVSLSRKSFDMVLSSSNDNYGSTFGDGEYLGGDIAIVKAVPAPGYTFVRWNDDITTPEREFVMNGNVSLTAIFDEATGVDNVSSLIDPLVDVYSIEGYIIKRKVKLSDVQRQLEKGFYIINSKKIRIQ